MKWTFVVLCLYLGSLFFREERIPGEWIERLFAAYAPTNLVFHCDSASLGFRAGLRMSGLKVYDRDKRETFEPLAAAESVLVQPLTRRLTIVGARYAHLPDSYYAPGYSSPSAVRTGLDGVAFPSLPTFDLVLVRPVILGVAPERVEGTVVSLPTRLDVRNVHLDWPDRTGQMSLDGSCSVDLEERCVSGEVRGLATQPQIRPLLLALDLPVSLPYMDAFTGIPSPVPASCRWNVDLNTLDFTLDLDLHPEMGRYNGVPMVRADGKLGIHSQIHEGWLEYAVSVGPLTSIDRKGRRLDGGVTIRCTNGVDIVVAFDARSELPFKSALDIVGYLNDGTLDCLTCETDPRVTIRGTLAADERHPQANDLHGTAAFEKGAFFGMPVRHVELSYAYVGDTVSFSNVTARGSQDGALLGSAEINIPERDAARADFHVVLDYANGSIAELEEWFGEDFGDRHGKVAGHLELSGPVATNFTAHLNGRGRVNVWDGKLAQMRLFASLTDLLADKIPGVSSIVDQSEGSADFAITNGVLSTQNVRIEGALFSILAEGTYDIVRDNLDFSVRVRFMKDDSFLGRFLIRPITWTFSKLLLEFKVTGSLDDPKWEYISVIDRIL